LNFDVDIPKIETTSNSDITFCISQRDSSEIRQLQDEVSRLRKENDKLQTQIPLSQSSFEGGEQTIKYQKRIMDLEKILSNSINEVEVLKSENNTEIVRLKDELQRNFLELEKKSNKDKDKEIQIQLEKEKRNAKSI